MIPSILTQMTVMICMSSHARWRTPSLTRCEYKKPEGEECMTPLADRQSRKDFGGNGYRIAVAVSRRENSPK